MYFDERPKTRREDLYDFDEQMERLLGSLKRGARLIVVKGLRRTGKTSLVKTCLEEAKIPYLFIDGRTFAQVPSISRADLMKALEQAINDFLKREKGLTRRFIDWIKNIRGVETSLKPPEIRLQWGPPQEAVNIPAVLDSLNRFAGKNRKRFVIVLDESQEFGRTVDYDLTRVLAYVYDNLGGVQLIVTGSQVGFLHDFLKTDDPKSPLFGRVRVDIETPHLSGEEAEEFLRKGFAQVKMGVEGELVKRAVRELDGIVGWLTYLGARAVEKRRLDEETLRESLSGWAKLAMEEFENFLAIRPQARRRYTGLMRRVSQVGRASWADLKRSLQAEEGKRIPDRRISDLLGNLVKGGFLKKNESGAYSIIDPLLKHAFERL